MTVNISPNYSTSQRQAIQAAFTNWQNSNGPGGNSSGVSFTFTFNSTPVSGNNTYQVNQQTLSQGQGETGGTTNGTNRTSAFSNIDSRVTNSTALTQVMAHEIGHTFGLDDCTSCANGTSVMTLAPCCNYNDTTAGRTGPSSCDNSSAKTAGHYQLPSGCSPSGQPPSTLCNWNVYSCSWDCQLSPILIDLLGNGFDMTDAANGVDFDINNDSVPDHISWTASGVDDAWLVLDRNGNRVVDNGSEMFGNFTPQPLSSEPNGFLALAEYDKPQNGGNGDGLITSQDSVFSSLRLWQDANHNGVSKPGELFTLREVGLATIDLDYRESRRMDQYGNWFRYRSRVRDRHGAHLGRWAWDVFLTATQ